MPRRRRRDSSGPPELRAAYDGRARPVGYALLSLVTPPPPGSPCTACRGCAPASGCFACGRWAHLLRNGDPAEYRRLVTRAFCAVSPAPDAPPPPRYTPGNAGFSQAQLVRQTIRCILADRSGTTNHLLCSANEGGQTKCVIDLVSSPSWDILLHRIGDLLMCYILWHSSIFLHIKKNDYFQVTGVPLNVVLRKSISESITARRQQPKSTDLQCATCYAWRNAVMAEDIAGGNCCTRSNLGLRSSANAREIDSQECSGSCGSVRTIRHNGSSEVCNCFKFSSTDGSTAQNPRKRKRLYKWQRRSKQKQTCSEGSSLTELSELSNSNAEPDYSAAKVNGQTHTSEPTADNSSLGRNNDHNSSQIEEPDHTGVSSETIPSSVMDMRRSQALCCGYSTSDVQSTCSQGGPICFNCLMLNASKCISVDSLIPRHTIFYNGRSSYNVFHYKHLLNKRNRPDALSLMKHIFGIKGCCIKFLRCNCHGPTSSSSNCLFHWLLKLGKKLVRNSRRCQYKKLFLKHCSVNSKLAEEGFSSPNVPKNDGDGQCSVGGKSTLHDKSSAHLEAYSTHQQVASFVWAVLTRIIPETLLGNTSSKRILRMNIWKLIKLRRFETFQLTDCVGELKVSHYAWLSNIGFAGCFCSTVIRKETSLLSGMEDQKQNNLLHCWIRWLFSDIIIPLIQTYFYVTERESQRHDVFYYPKSIWSNLTRNAITSLTGGKFKILRGALRRSAKSVYRSARVRFLPKENDMRPLVNLKAQSKNSILEKCHLIIKNVRSENPQMFGSSVFDYNSTHQKLSSFISSVRSQMEKSEIYIVVADVSKAFDCIDHDKLLSIMEDILKCDEYVLKNCSKIVCNRSKNAIYRFNSNVSVSKGNSSYDFSIQPSSNGGIFVDQGTVSKIRKEELVRLLSEQVKCNVLKLGKHFCLQQVGIAQGNKLSPMLSSLYYGDLENSVLLKFLHSAKINAGEVASATEYLMMRLVDDFIFITFSKKHAINFFNRMRRGFVFYNSYMNESKYGFNFNVGDSQPCCNRVYTGDDGVSFIPWSGLLINCRNLEIQADYTRYLDIAISSTITVKMHCSKEHLYSKLCHYMRPKCHTIFYDSTINSASTVRLNVYQAFLLCAMKFHCYMRSMSDASISKPELLQIIKRSFRYMHNHIIKRTQDAALQPGVHPVLKLRRKETAWLGLSAYIRVLGKKQSRHRDLLALLKAEAARHGHMERGCDALRYAVDDSHSSVFWKFKF